MFTKGADPEFFLVDPQTKKFISSINRIGGSKDFPMDIGDGCAVQEDNVAVEFNIPPCKTAEEYVKAINYALDHVRDRAKEMGLEIAITPSAVFDDDELAHPAAQEFGCEPDFNAWNGGEENPRPNAEDKNLRSAGGHIHIALEDGMSPIHAVQCMDLFVGAMMVEFDDDTRRRLLYGNPGAYRPKPYGVEYRTASNAWISSDERIRWVWDQTEKAMEFAKTGYRFSEEEAKMIQDCIRNSDKSLVVKLKEHFQL